MSNQYEEILQKWISFKSVSTDPKHADDINRCAEWLAELFKANGFSVEVVEGYGNPVVVASYIVSPDAKKVLSYGHYDVQPAEKSEGWKDDPFTLVKGKDRYIARGAIDNKGQVLVHMTTIFDLIKEKKLKYNVTFVIEGNEETGSGYLRKLLEDRQEELQPDVVIFSDGERKGSPPAIDAGFRGVMNAELTLSTSHKDIHSGIYGGVVPNAGYEMSALLGKLYDHETGRLNFPNLYDSVDPMDAEASARTQKMDFPIEEFKRMTGCACTHKEKDHNVYTCIGLRPSLEITTLRSGYQGEGYRNGVPKDATVKWNIRVPASVDVALAAKALEQFVKDNVPEYVKYELTFDEQMQGVIVELENEYAKEARAIVTDVYGEEPIINYCGATVPVVTDFKEIFKVPIVSISLGNDDCNMHAVGENITFDAIKKGMETSRRVFGS